jgi:hypothetical protein
VLQGNTYQYTVDAYDAAGNVSATSAAVGLTYPDTSPPSAPINLKATSGYKRLALSWAASVDNVAIAGYYIHRNA